MNDSLINVLVEIIKVIPTLLVGVIAARIAWQQSETAKEQRNIAQAKLKFDLFEKRLEYYNAMCELASAVESYRDHSKAIDALKRMILLSRQSDFLFGSDVTDLVVEMCEKIRVLGSGVEATIKNNNAVPENTLKEIQSANDWIKNAPLESVFKPYLDFSQWQ